MLNMDLDTLSLLVIDKFKNSGGYSELDNKLLFNSVRGYLESVYRINFYKTQQRIESEERQGLFPSSEKYKKEYEAVEDLVMACANKLAATTKQEI